MNEQPCHIVAVAGDRLTLCGLAGPPMPVVLQRHAIRHRYAMARCYRCFAAASLAVRFNLSPPVEQLVLAMDGL